MKNNRVLGFDFLRGLCSIGVAYYHILGWIWPDGTKLYSIGFYGVYIFFVLSGASIYISYADRIRAGYDLRKFISQRFFRLLPLFALVVLLGPAIDHGNLDGYITDFFTRAVMNITFVFGLGNPGRVSLPTGGWSLGIEFVFYLLFPVILSFISGSIRSSIAFLVIVSACQILFVQSLITGPGSLSSNWYGYTQFLAFAAYFVSGCLIGRIISADKLAADTLQWQFMLWLCFIALAGAILFASGTVRESPLLGKRGLLLPLVSVVLVLIAGLVRFPRSLSSVAPLFGNMSYGLYLLHPLVFTLIYKRYSEVMRAHPVMAASLLIALTFMVALVLEKYFERPIAKFGKGLINIVPTEINCDRTARNTA